MAAARAETAERHVMPHGRPSNVDKNVSPNWKPVAALEGRKSRITWSDRVWYWLVSLGGLAIIAVGVAIMAYLGLAKIGGTLIGVGFVVFVLGAPGQAARNGYRGH
jgi:hypothetical protein